MIFINELNYKLLGKYIVWFGGFIDNFKLSCVSIICDFCVFLIIILSNEKLVI